LNAEVEKPESDKIQPRCPALVRRQRRHHIGSRFSEQLINGNNLVSAGANAINNQRQRTDSLPPVTAAVVQQNNIAAALIVWRARWQVCQHIGRNLLGRAMRILPPVAWI